MQPDTRMSSSSSMVFSPGELEQIVVAARLRLYNKGLPCGALALRRYLRDDDVRPLPSARQIGQWLAMHGLTHARTGWYEGDKPEWLPQSGK